MLKPTDVYTLADLENPDSRLFEVMTLNSAVINQMTESVKKLKELHQQVKNYFVAHGSATAEELDENFFEPMNDIMDELSKDIF